MKTSRMHALTLTLALVALLGLSGLANAQMMGPGMMGGPQMMGGPMYGLTPEKQAAAQKLYADFNAKTATLGQQSNAKQYELNVLLNTPNPDDKKIKSLSKEIADLNSKFYEAQAAFQNQLAREGIPAMGGMGMMAGGMHHGMGMGWRCW
ncbi:periplasmic heavy metal sensor [Fundidesulfovibrio putealis]|uniref:periplasmic heavy metal sensor n=1 Tax=Fundidesulfovibrio putealis TaxID=270496 RepID=UPI000486CF05|nr:periplasmic heavy metal sensor [Fundidesulfovibrio putealis]